MKTIIQLESLGLLVVTAILYSQLFPHSWGFFALVFFTPDLSFIAYAFSKKWGAFCYNVMHHQGIIAFFIGIFWWSNYSTLLEIGIIFLAHSFFDRIWGYGLKYNDSFNHTHMGWIGKESALNV